MKTRFAKICALLLIVVTIPCAAFAAAYDGTPKLIVIVVIDQFRGDYLERVGPYLNQSGGFRLFTQGAYFANCHYDYANTETAPGHATLLTGAYSDGHGIFSNEMWDEQGGRWISSVSDDSVRALGIPGSPVSASPHNLL